MKTEFILIDPAMAIKLLEKNTMNRMPRPRIIREYARQMTAGLWKEETGESIKIALDGTILDGQQRLMAIIQSNVSLSFMVISELDKDVFKVLDSGTKRTGGDILHTAGITNSKNKASAILRYKALKIGSVKLSDAPRFYISNSEVLIIYNERQKFWDAAINMGQSWYNESSRLLTISEFSALYAFFYDINSDDSFNFIDKLASGVGLENDDPIKRLRDKLMFAKINPRFSIPNYYRTGMIYKAWNFYRDKKALKVLKFSDQEEFPVPK